MKEKLLLLHGALGSKAQFSFVRESLEVHFHVYDLNFDGHGGSESDKPFSIGLFTDNVLDYLQVQSIDQVTIFGYSMGGYVALNAALRVPEKIKKIITLGTKFNWDEESTAREVKMLNPEKTEEKVPRFAEKLRRDHHPQDWKEVMSKTADMMTKMAAGARLFDTDLEKIKLPVTIGVGSLDTMVSLEESERASSLLPNAHLVKIDGGRHPIDTLEAPTILNYILDHS